MGASKHGHGQGGHLIAPPLENAKGLDSLQLPRFGLHKKNQNVTRHGFMGSKHISMHLRLGLCRKP